MCSCSVFTYQTFHLLYSTVLAEAITLCSRISKTLPETVLKKMHASPKPNYPLSQWKAFWDASGGIWMSGNLTGKYFGIFVSTLAPGGGQEATVMNSLSTFAHHGTIYVPLGYSMTFTQMTNLEEVRVVQVDPSARKHYGPGQRSMGKSGVMMNLDRTRQKENRQERRGSSQDNWEVKMESQ
ncbi:hypothetical protein D9758_008563 [Tetrapyrgos nigripes]|uniref:Uncharacterized protein n=1 Tax=Tetrapyrgos nigripes TaxID=182062 RepID=A0A8H5LIZ3_9AGAR|nr:hypothetical protein D9758_008563 [Tetrapyrgos nigripes]